ncbi:MAG: sugar phosphate nucleotidyltransferase [Fimbriimonadaceae bacterium]|jgi:mannose-1-phosphate guanylyltransferase|nr:sugar phosphate nucleotidyltransferase [Fimbriimonadaceae bacterium]
MKRIAIIMAGGSGERFWPVSTKERPKQFLKLASPEKTLLEEAVSRAADVVGESSVFIATGSHLQEATKDLLPFLPPHHIFAEPHKRNTAGCLIWVAANLIAARPDDWAETSLAILTADQRIVPVQGFLESVTAALETVEQYGGIATIGIRPTRPETGFGYIEVGEAVGAASQVTRFREKPDIETARRFLVAGNFLWNSGMFFCTVGTLMTELTRLQPEMAQVAMECAKKIAEGKSADAADIFSSCPNISIDYAVMERAEKVFVIEANFDWDDLGSWDSLERSYPKDPHGNVSQGTARMIDCNGSIAFNDTEDFNLSLLGLENVVVVVSGKQIMVCEKSRAQEVKRFLNS